MSNHISRKIMGCNVITYPCPKSNQWTHKWCYSICFCTVFFACIINMIKIVIKSLRIVYCLKYKCWSQTRGDLKFCNVIGNINRPIRQKASSIKSLWPSDTTRSGSALGQVMACCLAAQSHYPNQCWHITNFTVVVLDTTHYKVFESYIFENTGTSPTAANGLTSNWRWA